MTYSRSALFAFALFAVCLAPAVGQDRRGPFTHEPRSVRSRELDQQHIKLDLRIDLDQQELKGRATHRLAPYKPLATVTLDAAGMHIQRVALVNPASQQDERELKYQRHGRALVITLDREYQAEESLVLAIDYRVSKPEHGAHFVMPDASEPDQPKMMWTQSEPEYAHYWYPCVDSSADRLTSEIVVTAAKPLLVLSNGSLKSKSDNPDGTQTWHWTQEKSHVTYLLSVVVGDFEALEQSWDGIPVVSYVPKGRLPDAARSFEKTPAMMKFFSQKIGYRYPWPKYAQICVDEYGWGGMEHTSATTLNVRTLHDERGHLDTSSDNLVAHELAHQWWGDLLTCKDWGELWLNESFATYFASLWAEQDEGWDEATWQRAQEARSYQDQDRTVRRSIVTYRYDTPEHMFDQHSYPKGGRVLHMLRFELGDDQFWKALNRYVSVNQFRTVETADLRIAIDEATGQGFNWFFDQWIHHGGHPEFTVSWHWDDATKAAVVTVKQTQRVDDVTPLFRTAVEIELASPQATVLRRVNISKAEETFHFPMESRPSRVCFDPKDWILKTLNFDKSKEEFLDQLANDAHVMCRVQAAQGLTQFAKEDDVTAALIRCAQGDKFWGVRQEAVKALARLNTEVVRGGLLRVALTDTKSQVRREALIGLGSFPHEETRKTLRSVVRNDRSYYAIAEALKALVKVDRDHCEADLLAALDVVSHDEVIERAATQGLVELKSSTAVERVSALLSQRQSPERRMVFISALARLQPEDPKYLAQVREHLANDRGHVRRSAADALVDLGNPVALEWLLERRGKEEMPSAIRAFDQSIEKLRGKERNVQQLQKDLEQLRQQNRQLEERLKKLEDAASKR